MRQEVSANQVRAARRGRWLRVGLTLSGLALAAVGAGLAWKRPTRPQPSTVLHGPSLRAEQAWFDNVAPGCGIDFQHDSGSGGAFYLPESAAGGVGLLDYDRDGYLDAYFVQGGSVLGASADTPGNRLFRNLGDGTFRDVTGTARVGDIGYGMGCTCGDFDNDGWPDIYVTNVGSNVLYRNNGDGTFQDVTAEAHVGDPSFSSSAAFVDYDHDGNLDLFVVNYIRWSPEQERECTLPSGQRGYCTPKVYKAPAADTLYRNNGDGTFTDVTQSSGISAMFGNGLGIVCGDFNGDGLTDLAVANDLLANQLWINQGDGTFRDHALERGVAYNGYGRVEAGMGIDAQDVDGDGDLDLFMTHFGAETNTLYINEGSFYVDRTDRFGLTASLPFTGFGTALIDFNNDGRLDIYVANGRVNVSPTVYNEDDLYAEPNQLFEGLSDGAFQEVTPRGGTAELLAHSSRGAAFGDYDNDGDVDIFVVNRDGPAYVLKNRAGRGNHWIAFHVTNRHGSSAIGARVEIEVGGRKRIRDVRTGYSYCASNDPRVYFGLGKVGRVDVVHVTWTDGTVQAFGSFAADQIVLLSPSSAS